MIGYELGSSLVGAYIIAKTSPVENFKHGLKNHTVANMPIVSARGGSLDIKFLGQPQSLGQETRPTENSNLKLF